MSDPSAMMGLVPVTDDGRPLLGRERELTLMGGLLDLAATGPGRGVLVAGDAGVGKTRLLTEVVARARGVGWRTVVGHCLDFGDSALPYLPFTEVFGRLATDDPEAAAGLTRSYAALAHLQPGRRLLSGGDGDGPSGDRLDRSDLFEAVHGAFEELAAATPLLVVVEDVHWADRSTRDLLTYLFTRPFRGSVRVVASYRSDDLHRRHPLRAAAAQWVRVPGVQRLLLEPLPDDEVRRLVDGLSAGPGRGLTEAEAHAIVTRAEGNAFFAEELVGAATVERGGAGLPEDLADLLLVRLDRLDDAAREVVRAAACAGRRVSHALLAGVVALPDAELDRALRTTVEQNVLTRVGADGYAFRHALLAEAVYDDLLPGERVRLHAAYTAALLARRVDGTAAELARHARAAHDRVTALRASVRAGDEAMSVGGPDEAARHFETALELLVDADETPDVDPVLLTSRAADALVTSGHPERARKLVAAQLRALTDGADSEQRVLLLEALARATLLLDGPADALTASTEALQLVGEETGPLRIRLLALHARALTDRGRDDEATRFALEALTLAQRLDLPAVVADATTTLAGIDQRAGDPAAAERALAEVVERAQEVHDTTGETRGRFLLARLVHERGDLPSARKAYQRGAAAARTAGQPWAPYALEARVMEASTAYEQGLWDECVELTRFTGRVPPLAEAMLLATRAAVLVQRQDPHTDALLEQVRGEWERDGWIAVSASAVEIERYGDLGDVRAMGASFDRAMALVDTTGYYQARIRLTALLLGRLATAAADATRSERTVLVDHAPALLDGVARVMRRVEERRRPFGPEGLAWLERVGAEHLRLRRLADVDAPDGADAAVAAWQRTVTGFETIGHVFETARSRARLGAVLHAAGRPAESQDELGAARGVAAALGASTLLAEVDRSGVARAAARPTASHRDAALTARETEILGLVAQGRSNGEIARLLFISVKTVSVHVSNILAKLGAGGRTEAAAIARREGLLPGG